MNDHLAAKEIHKNKITAQDENVFNLINKVTIGSKQFYTWTLNQKSE